MFTNGTWSPVAFANADFTPPTELRTTMGIIWSCLVTIFACTWTNLHPNILPGATSKRRLQYHGYLFLIAVFVPDAILAWAMRQCFASRKITKLYEGCPDWTLTHSQFAIMGGFLYKENRGVNDEDGCVARADGEPLGSLIRLGKIKIAEEDIMDRSKNDLLSKGFALLQTLWFVLQFFGRVCQRLPVTELEILTLAYAALNFLIYAFWWNKPQRVNFPVEVYAERPDGNEDTRRLLSPDIPGGECVEHEASPSLYGTKHYKSRMVTLRQFLLNAGGQSSPLHHSERLKDLWTALDSLPLPITCVYLFVHIAGGGVEGKPDTGFITPDCMWHDGQSKSNIGSWTAFTTAAALALVLGLGHLVAWYFPFPSRAECIIWRTLAVYITLFPIYAFFLCFDLLGSMKLLPLGSQQFSELFQDRDSRSWRIVKYILLPMFFGTIYILARLILIVQVFCWLRSQPPGVYQVVLWTNYIPHV